MEKQKRLPKWPSAYLKDALTNLGLRARYGDNASAKIGRLADKMQVGHVDWKPSLTMAAVFGLTSSEELDVYKPDTEIARAFAVGKSSLQKKMNLLAAPIFDAKRAARERRRK